MSVFLCSYIRKNGRECVNAKRRWRERERESDRESVGTHSQSAFSCFGIQIESTYEEKNRGETSLDKKTGFTLTLMIVQK